MKYIKTYPIFINEGVYIDSDGELILNSRNDSKNNDEVLKTTGGQVGKRIEGVSFFEDTPSSGMSLPNNWIFPKFHGLSTNSYHGKVDHLGRFKYTMDKLKAGEIKDIETSLPEFIDFSFKMLKIKDGWTNQNSELTYLVATGSTKGLVSILCDSIKRAIGKDIPVITLKKVEYLNAGDAVDWNEVREQMVRQSSSTNPGGIKSFNKLKRVVSNYVNNDKTPEHTLKLIDSATTADDLENLLIGPDSEVVWKSEINGEKMIPFIVRSSGRNYGGTRSFWRKKYDYSEKLFLEAVIDCATSIKSTNVKKMLIVDDNINSGNDVRLTKANIESVINNIFPGEISRRQNAQSLFGFYLLYNMGKTSGLEYTAAGQIDSATGRDKIFKDFDRRNIISNQFADFKGYPKI